MEIQVTKEERRVSITVISLSGPLTDGEQLEKAADVEIEAGARHILVDLSAVPYTATSGLRALHHIFDRLRTIEQADSDEDDPNASMREGISSGSYVSPHLKLLKPSKNSLHALQVSGYDMFLQIFDKRDKALDAF